MASRRPETLQPYSIAAGVIAIVYDQKSELTMIAIVTNLALSLPVLEIFDLTASTDLHVFACSDEHVSGRDDVCDWWLARVISSYPDGDRYVVGCPTIGDRQKTMEA